MHKTSQLALPPTLVRPLFGVTRVEKEGMLSQGIVF